MWSNHTGSKISLISSCTIYFLLFWGEMWAIFMRFSISQHSSLSLLLFVFIFWQIASLGRGRCVLWCVKWLDGLKRFRSVCHAIPHIMDRALKTPFNWWWSGRRRPVAVCLDHSVRDAWSIFHLILGKETLDKSKRKYTILPKVLAPPSNEQVWLL